jgi:hypothetical protein
MIGGRGVAQRAALIAQVNHRRMPFPTSLVFLSESGTSQSSQPTIDGNLLSDEMREHWHFVLQSRPIDQFARTVREIADLLQRTPQTGSERGADAGRKDDDMDQSGVEPFCWFHQHGRFAATRFVQRCRCHLR